MNLAKLYIANGSSIKGAYRNHFVILLKICWCLQPVSWHLQIKQASVSPPISKLIIHATYPRNVMSKCADSHWNLDTGQHNLDHFVLMQAFIVNADRRWHCICEPVQGGLGQELFGTDGLRQCFCVLSFRWMICPIMVLFQHPSYIYQGMI